jgi:cytochrome P450
MNLLQNIYRGTCRVLRTTQYRSIPATLESFGVAVDFLSRFEPFTRDPVGPFVRAVRRQILRQQHLFAFDGEKIVGYAGWLPTTRQAAEAWLRDGGELRPADENPEAVALTIVAVDDPAATLGLMREARRINPGLRVFFKRNYSDATRTARKSAVQNMTGHAVPARPAEQPAATSAGQEKPVARPPIADDPCAFLYALAERSPGTTERIAVGQDSVVVVQDPEIAAKVLVGNLPNYRKNFSSFTPFFGRSRLTLDGPAWRRSQRISQSHIAPHDARRAADVFNRLYAELGVKLAANGAEPYAIDSLVDQAAVGALTEVAFSTPSSELGDAFAADLRPIIRYAAMRAWDLPGVPPSVDGQTLAEAQGAASRIRGAVGEMVARRRKAEPRKDALSALVGAADITSNGPEDEQVDLAGELLTLVVAGSDTTSAALGWVLSILASLPDFQDTLREEIRAAFGTSDPTMDDLDRLPTLRALIEETLRMFPPVAILSRFAEGPDDLGGHVVAAGDRVLVSVIGLHQNPASWEAPREFRLERHDRDSPGKNVSGKSGRKSHFMAFSAGPRICGGARFARIEIEIALVQILRRCRLELAGPLPLAFEWGASMRRLGGQRMRVTGLQERR